MDTTDLHRLEDCRSELHNLLKEERLTGATLLIFANKQDLAGSLAAMQLQKVSILFFMELLHMIVNRTSSCSIFLT